MKWKIIDTGKATAKENMAIDYAFLRDLPNIQQPILHLYDWEGESATFGHFLDPYKYLDRNAVKNQGLQLAKRPTGGGIIFHLTDFAYSLLIPASHPNYSVNTLQNYAFVNNIIAKVMQKFLGTNEVPNLLQSEPQISNPYAKHFCMAQPTQYDVMWGGKKIGGGAQRRTKYGFLHQGTISLIKPDLGFLENVLIHGDLADHFIQNTFFIESLKVDVIELKEALRSHFESL